MKNPFKKNKQASVPRTEEEIKRAYFDLCRRTGELQYQISVFQEELKNTNSGMRELNYEMDARLKLNAAAKAEDAAKKATEKVATK